MLSWQKMGLAIAVSTEPHLFIRDVFRSPFNVGLNIGLRLFNRKECQHLNRLYGARLKREQLDELMILLNGHPHLTHIALYSLTGPSAMEFSTLVETAPAKDGPFGAHLRALEYKLLDEIGSQVLAAMKKLVNEGNVFSRDDFHRLQSAGLARDAGNRLVATNGLYDRFFRDL